MSDAEHPPALTHLDRHGRARMVDVSGKEVTARRAVAEGHVRVSPRLADCIRSDTLEKGNLLETARLAGIQAAKRTGELIPLCHVLPLEHVDVETWLEDDRVGLRAEVKTCARTGVEMEAIVAVVVAALTVIDMGKAIDRTMVITGVRLVEKSGGRSGDFRAAGPPGKEDCR